MYCMIVIPLNSVADKVGFEQNEILFKSEEFGEEKLEELSGEILSTNEEVILFEGCIATIVEEE